MCRAQSVEHDDVILVLPRRSEGQLPPGAAVLKVLEGAAVARCGVGPWRLGPGDLLLKPAERAGRVEALEPLRARLVILGGQQELAPSELSGFAAHRVRSTTLSALLDAAPGAGSIDKDRLDLECRRLAQAARAATDRIPARRPERRQELFRRVVLAKDAMDRCDPPVLSLDQVSAEAHLSPYHLHRTFSSAFGVTPSDYLRQRRLQLAVDLLNEDRLPIGIVAERCGFVSFPAFSRWFRQMTGATPSAARRGPGSGGGLYLGAAAAPL